MARPEPMNFLELPIEILGQILQPLLTTPGHTPILLCPCSPAPFPPRSVLSILLTHPRLHAIACPLLYGPSNSFLLDLTGEHSSHVRRRREVFEAAQVDDVFLINDIGNHSNSLRHAPDGSFFSLPTHRRRRPLLATAPALRRLQNLTIRVDRLRGWIQDDIVPVVSDMIMQGHLQQLRLYLATTTLESLSSSTSSSSSTTGARRPRIEYSPQAAGRPPLAGLLRLLADPDLGHSGLWIEGRHHAGWDQFQRDDTSQELGEVDGSRSDGRDGRDLAHHQEQAVELDWRKVLESAAEMQAADWQTSV